MTETSTDRIAEASVVLARIYSKTRVRLNVRGVAVDEPAEHAKRVVRFLTQVAGEPYCASPERSERVLSEFAAKYTHLTEATYQAPEPVLVTPNGVRVHVDLVAS